MRRSIIITVFSLLLLGPIVAVPPQPAAAAAEPSAYRSMKAQKGAYAEAAPPPIDPSAKNTMRSVPKVTWPAAGTARVALTGTSGRRVAGTLPVRVGGRTAGPDRVTVTMLDRGQSQRAGVSGPMVRLAAPAAGKVSVEIDYAGFRDAYGGGWADRLHLVRVPDCAATKPADPACRPVPLATTNDQAKGVASADVELAGATAVVALASDPAGSGGDFSASSPAASGTWSAGGSSGDFNWQYPMRTPPPLGGPGPQLALGYSSGSLDGRTAASNNQPSWAGEGFDLWSGSVTRSYRACSDDGQANVGDLCWGGDNATLSLGAHGGELIQESGNPDRWHLRNDDGTKVERVFGADNGAFEGEHWRVTTTDGVQYFFGLNKLPGHSGDAPVTSSAWTVPVFGNQDRERCNKPAGFAASWCMQAYRWNLDYVVDPHGNSMSVWYDTETNNYARNRTDGTVSGYVRGGTINRIEYGTRREGGADSRFTGTVPMKTVFGAENRCVTAGATCTLTKTNAANWPDVPMDQLCDSGSSCPGVYSPTFWTQRRLSTVTTFVLRGSTMAEVDQWKLNHVYKDPGDGRAKIMWLGSIAQTGLVGGSVTLPAVTFNAVPMNNRVDRSNTLEPIIRYRISSIESATGGVTSVTYAGQDCAVGSRMPSTPQDNNKRCYPVYWTRPGQSQPGFDYFHKYVVSSVTEADRTGGAPASVTGYRYLDEPSWHYDEAEFVAPAKRSYGQYRGYGRVRVTTGESGQVQSQTDTLYFRGMDRDKLPNKGSRSVSVTDSDGVALPDSAWRQGQTREVIVYNGTGDAAPVVTKTVTDPWQHGPIATRERNEVVVQAYATGASTTTVKTALDGGRGWRTSKVTNTFDYDDGSADPTGRITRKDDTGDVATTADDRCTRITFAANVNTHALAYPAEIETVGVRCGATPDRAKDTLSRVRVAYDGGASVGKGDQVKVEKMVGWKNDAPVFQQAMRATYDAYGRVEDQYDSLDRKTSTAYTPESGPLITTTVTNALDWTTSTTVDPGRGLPTLEVDANGRRTESAYDPLGRLAAVWAPGRTRSENPNVKFTYDVRSGAPAVTSVARLNTAGTGYLTSYQIYDGLMRERQTQTPAVGGGSMITDVGYDTRGKVRKSTAPYFMAGAPSGELFVPEGEPQSATWSEYDPAGRIAKTSLKASGAELWHTTHTYGGDHTDTTPPAGGTATTLYVDARGQQSELRQYKSADAYDRTRYTYTATGKPATLTDEAGNIWTWTYDDRDRLIATSDPDKGVTTRTYDEKDQLATFTDARGGTLAYTYDELGRRTSIRQSTATGPKLASWDYDTLLKGYPTGSTRYVGDNAYRTAVTGYDEANRPTGKVVTIPASEGKLAGTYEMTQTYHADGSPRATTLPAMGGLPAETLTYGYNPTGQTTSLTGAATYLNEAVYDQAGRLGMLIRTNAAGQDLLEEWAYDEATGRVTEHAGYGDVDPEVITDAHYTYDQAGNMLGIADLTSQYASGPDDRQCFGYDRLERLTEAWTPAVNDCTAAPAVSALGGPAPYWQSWTHDATGNRLTQVDHAAAGNTTQTLTYPEAGKPRAHAATSVKTAGPGGTKTDTYTYDPDGNVLTRPGAQTLTWDPEGRLASVLEAGRTTSYVYDAEGNRLVEHGPDSSTLFTDLGECTATGTAAPTCVRSYAVAGRVVAVRTTQKVSWQVADHQATGTASVDSATMAVTRRRSLPYGGARGPNPAWDNRHGFVNGIVDGTGLVHLGAREYDPKLGRFLSVDPILDNADPQSLNGYTYAGASPVTDTDPDGKVKCPDGDCKANPQLPVDKIETVAHRDIVEEEYFQGNPKMGVSKRKSTPHTYKVHQGKVEDHYGCTNVTYGVPGGGKGPVRASECEGDAGMKVLGPVTACHKDNTGPVCWEGEDGFIHDINGGKSCARNDFNFCATKANQVRRDNRGTPPTGGNIPKIGPAGPAAERSLGRSGSEGWLKSMGVCLNFGYSRGTTNSWAACLAYDDHGWGGLLTSSRGVTPGIGVNASIGMFGSNGTFEQQYGDSESVSAGWEGGVVAEGVVTRSDDGKVYAVNGNAGASLGIGPPVGITDNYTKGWYFPW
ncbi:RHS repeat-associated core domain-containing protein [Actinoplanes sp. NBRC 103695]|uniref:RHS repeat domain-containing protein n=1 Tax=Actinoplanes sp. NBRC 103695 TaxID=3032202 RepID=UPI0024A12635|nr:RHS repeat-associated core domain-containing protein [Actinoplanes sp. NBRC 103695]GLY98558.1 hypothetical protein Acsp02_58120 [Actinoplanes sp. NBRC 103695]